MNKIRIRWVIVLGAISMLGIALSQIYWVNRAMDISEKELDQTLNVALLNVAEDMAKLNNHVLASQNPVSQLSSNYFVVEQNDIIDANILEHYISSEFRKRKLFMDFEYGIYDCSSDKMVYGNYVGTRDVKKTTTELPKWEDNIYYFGVRLPERQAYILGDLRVWMVSTIIVLMVLLLFAYSLFIILKQKRLSEVQKDFVNTMTHEFKTPLSTIAISANVLAESDLVKRDKRLGKYTEIIQEENTQLSNQVEKLLQMTDLEKEKIILKLETIGLNDLLNKVSHHFELKINERDGSLKMKLEAHPDVIRADKVHLTNIFYNLIDNAIKYSPDVVEIKVETRTENNNLIVEITDKGQGITKENQSKIFHKFYRVPTGDVHDVKGFGLGLSYVKKLVQTHKWKISATSELGKGSSFIIEIPANINNE